MNPLRPLYRLADKIRYGRHADPGKRGEDLAHRYLRKQGMLIVARNWRPPQGGGEVDLVACESSDDGDTLVFVEVKSRLSGELNAPERAVDLDKQMALRRAARDYVRRAEADPQRVRFDVITITGALAAGGEIQHFRDAFPAW